MAADIDPIALDVARRFTEEWDPQRRASLQVHIVEAIRAALAARQPVAQEPFAGALEETRVRDLRESFDVAHQAFANPAARIPSDEWGGRKDMMCPDDEDDGLDFNRSSWSAEVIASGPLGVRPEDSIVLTASAAAAVQQVLMELLQAATAAPPAQGIDLVPRPMDTAPRDGTMVRLLVQFTEHATEDTAGPAWTIGANNGEHDGGDLWCFAGWCWTHDHFTEGKGTPVGWLPLIDGQSDAAPGVANA